MVRQKLNQVEQWVIPEIQTGKLRDSYLIYNRKSTDDTDNQKNSIKYQKSENMRYAAREHLPIAPLTLDGFCTDGIVSEKHSGFKEDVELYFGKDNTVQYRVERPKFLRMVQLLNNGCFKGVIILCWDRASRNKGDDTIIRKLMKSGVDVRFTLAKYEKTSSGELHMDIDGMFAEHHSRVTREKVTMTILASRSRGLCTNKAPVGYLNPGGMEHKPFDPGRASLIKELFAKAATGQWSLSDLARWAISQGFTMPPVRRRRTMEEILAEEEDDIRLQIEQVCRPPTLNNIHKILKNPFYKGMVPDENGQLIPSISHKPLVSTEVWEQVQKQLRNRNKSAHYIVLLEHPLRGVVRCAKCSRVYTPYPQKGTMYYGSRCVTGCANTRRNFNFDFIARKIGDLIASLSFSGDELAEIDRRASTDIALLDAKRLDQIDSAERRKKRIREDLAYLNANRLTLLKTGAYSAENLVAEEATLNLKLTALCDAETASDISMRETVNDAVRLSELLKNGYTYYSFANPEEKEKIIRVIFSELKLSGDTLEYQCRNGFQALARRFVPNCDPTGWLSELAGQQSHISECLKELAALLPS
jgi:site-specific DNA recombinase